MSSIDDQATRAGNAAGAGDTDAAIVAASVGKDVPAAAGGSNQGMDGTDGVTGAGGVADRGAGIAVAARDGSGVAQPAEPSEIGNDDDQK